MACSRMEPQGCERHRWVKLRGRNERERVSQSFRSSVSRRRLARRIQGRRPIDHAPLTIPVSPRQAKKPVRVLLFVRGDLTVELDGADGGRGDYLNKFAHGRTAICFLPHRGSVRQNAARRQGLFRVGPPETAQAAPGLAATRARARPLRKTAALSYATMNAWGASAPLFAGKASVLIIKFK
jgi:hypothetical protein